MLLQQIKRKSMFDHSSNEKIPKTSIENLANEIFYEIFDYLDGIDLYHAFSNLNEHFQQLLNSSCLLFKIEHFHTKPIDPFIDTWKKIHLFHQQQILSIRLLMSSHTDEFYLSSLFTNSLLDRLQSLVLIAIKSHTAISLLEKLKSLPRLFVLDIAIQEHKIKINDIHQLVFNLPVLKSYTLSTSSKNSITSLPFTKNRFSPIKYLFLDCECDFNDLSIITSYTSQLRHLEFICDFHNDQQYQSISLMDLPNLTHLTLCDYDSTFYSFRFFMLKSKFYTNLKVLRIDTIHQDLNFLNSNRWEKFLTKHLPKLEKFYLTYYENFDIDDIQFPIYSGQSNQFTSSFWIKKQWLFDVEIESDYITYSVCPYQKRWYQYIEDDRNYSKSNLLKISGLLCAKSDEPLLNCVKRSLSITKIYHLEVSASHELVIRLIEMINLLPELYSLRLHNLCYVGLENSDYIEELYDLQSNSNLKHLTKVYLEEISFLEEIIFFLKFFPYMTSLKIDYIGDSRNTELNLQSILTEINNHQHSLCLHLPKTNNTIIEKLKELLRNYTIKFIVDNVHVE